MVLRLCLGMPSTHHWNLTRQTVLRDKCTFQEAVAQFQAAERLQAGTSASGLTDPATANFAKDGSKSKGRGRWKGKKSSWKAKDKLRNTTSDTSEDESNKCFWCLRKGHM
jgi:hypothetical protein